MERDWQNARRTIGGAHHESRSRFAFVNRDVCYIIIAVILNLQARWIGQFKQFLERKRLLFDSFQFLLFIARRSRSPRRRWLDSFVVALSRVVSFVVVRWCNAIVIILWAFIASLARESLISSVALVGFHPVFHELYRMFQLNGHT